MEKPGLLHIGERILKNLDFQTQPNGRLVNRAWNQILENEASKTKKDLNNLLESVRKSANHPNPENITFLEYCEITTRDKICLHWIQFAMAMSTILNNHAINVLLKKHIKYQFDDEFSAYPLEHFVLKRDVKMVDLILKQKLFYFSIKSAVSLTTSEFDSGLKKAIEKRYSDIVQCFKPFMTFWHHDNYVFEPITCGYPNALKMVYPNPKDSLPIIDRSGNNSIHIGASRNLTLIVKYFIENIDGLTAQNNSGHTPLYYAITNYNHTNFRNIVKAVPEDHILKPIINGMNVIHIAARSSQLIFVKQLCNKVTNPIVPDDRGNSPIHYAASNGHLEMLEFLAKYCTDLTIPNGNGKTPLQLAKLKGHSKVVKYLSQF